MAVRVLFRCEHCQTLLDPETQRTLEGQLRGRTVGEYRDAEPGGWLIWTAGGALGPKRYACPQHRDELIAYLRTHYGALRSGVWKTEPYGALWPDGFCGLREGELDQLLADDQRPPLPPARRRATQA